jgi:hemerythrin
VTRCRLPARIGRHFVENPWTGVTYIGIPGIWDGKKQPALQEKRMSPKPNPAEYSPDLTLGIAELDEQHQTIFTMLGRVDSVSPDMYRQLDDDETDEMLDIMNDLKDSFMQHFSYEENLMDEADYPGLDDQQDAHERFLDDITRMEAELMNGSSIPPVKIHGYLADWFDAHIREMDLPFAQFRKENTK